MKWFLLYYRPLMELLGGNTFILVCPEVSLFMGSGLGSPCDHYPMWCIGLHCTGTHPHSNPAASDIRHGPGPSPPPVPDMGLPSPPTLPPAKDICWPSLVHLKTPTSTDILWPSRKILRWLAGGMHPTRILSCYLSYFFIYMYIPTSNIMFMD